MTFELPKRNMMIVINFLSNLTLPRKVSRASSKLIASLQTKLSELADDEKDLIEKYNGTVDEGGNISGIKTESFNEFNEAHSELLNETVIIDISYKEQPKVLLDFFEEWNEPISPEQVVGMNAFYDLLDSFNNKES